LYLWSLAGCSAAGPPAIGDVFPRKGERDVAADAQIRVGFDRAMDRVSVEQRFSVNPEIPGCSMSACPLAWEGSTLVLAHRGHELNPGARYRVVIRAGFHDLAGNVNGLEHSWTFVVEASPSLRGSSPQDGARNVDTSADVVLHFSRAMRVPARELVSLTPAVPLRLSLAGTDPSLLVVAPIHLLKPQSSYTLTVSPAVQDTHHSPLGRSLSVRFRTGATDLSQKLSFLVRGGDGAAHAVAVLQPPATVSAPLPTLRLVYETTDLIDAYGWTPGGTALYVGYSSPPAAGAQVAHGIRRVALGNASAQELTPAPAPLPAALGDWIGVAPGADELAFVDNSGRLHLWDPAAAGREIAVPQAGQTALGGSWSGDGRRLALVVDVGAAARLAIVDRGTLSRFLVPDVTLATDASGGVTTAPAWSFDGSSIAFARRVESGAGSVEVWSYRLDSGRLERIGPFTPTSLEWSSEGSTIYATGVTSEGASPSPAAAASPAIRRAPATALGGANPGFTAVDGSGPSDREPATCSFDRRLAFIRDSRAQPQLWLMNGNGTGVEQITFASYDTADQLTVFGVDDPEWVPAS